MLEVHNISRREFLGLGAVAGLGLLTAGCGSSGQSGDSTGQGSNKMTLAYQPNFGYAPVMIMKQKGWLEAALPQWDITYQRVNSGSLIRNGILSGDIQVGALAVAPFLVGWDGGVDWKILSGLSDIDQWMMVMDDRIRSLKDFTSQDKIALLSPDNNQTAFLRIACKEQLGDPNALKSNEVYQPHATGMQSLLSKRVAAHFTNPPYQYQEQAAGARRVLSSYQLFGGADNSPNFGMAVVSQQYFDRNPEAMDTLKRTIRRAAEFLEANVDESAKLLAKEFGDNSPDKFAGYLKEEGMQFTTDVKGVIEMANGMKEAKMIEKVPNSQGNIIF